MTTTTRTVRRQDFDDVAGFNFGFKDPCADAIIHAGILILSRISTFEAVRPYQHDIDAAKRLLARGLLK